MTVYQQIQRFYQHDKFRFQQRAKLSIGMRVIALWREMNPGKEMPPMIESQEDTGTYKVIDYPEEFSSLIYQLIRTVHQEILQAAKKRKEKAAAVNTIPTAPPPDIPITPPVNTEKRKRKRIPVRSQPLWKAK